MRNTIWISACILGTLLVAAPSFGQSQKIRICHVTGKNVRLMEINPQALGGHLVHGDYPPYDVVIDEVPGVPYC
jgi:hypothetical protein